MLKEKIREKILPKNRLILAVDVANFDLAKELILKTKDQIHFYKIGLELAMSPDYFKLLEFLKNQNKKIFCDLKLFDISATVGKAVKNLAKFDVDLLTIHTASSEIMKAAAQNKSAKMKIVGVTVLTNLEKKDLDEMGFDPKLSIEELVLKKAALAIESGLDGVVSSALEAKILRKNFGDDFVIVTPGIRPNGVVTGNDDQKRVADVKTALGNGSDYLVVGRPISQAQNPSLAAAQIVEMIEEFYAA
jgi:orotidine-5'-phosphate decarboxylase